MRRHASRPSAWSACAALACASLGLNACFVSEGDCVQQGVEVDPCFVTARPGQTILLNAQVIGAPDEPVDWILPASAGAAFSALADGNRLTLISKQNVPGSFPVQAESQTDSNVFGGSVVGVQTASYGSQPPPFVIAGGDFPPGSKFGATAVGGNLYFVAYADAGGALQERLGGGESSNFFVKRYGLADDALNADVPGQFQLFAGAQTTTPIIPNIAADCAGNGYWLDAEGTGAPTYFLRRLRPGTTVPVSRSLGQFASVGFRTIAVSCAGQVYFVARTLGANNDSLFQLASFGAPLRAVPIAGYFADFIDALSVDVQGRLLVADLNPDGTRGVERLIVSQTPTGPEASIDPDFNVDPFFEGAGAVTSDASGVVYAAGLADTLQVGTPPALVRIVAFNELGGTVYTISTYEYECPSGCPLSACGDDVPFTDILSLGVSGDGRLRVVDDVLTDSTPAACQETIRFLLIDPQ